MGATVTSIAELQFENLRSCFPGSTIQQVSDNSHVIFVPDIVVAAGWNQAQTAVYFFAPVGFPSAKPDCFWADASLRLASGAMPANSTIQALPLLGSTQLWFSWHLVSWDPARDSLLTYVRVIQERLSRAQ